MTFALVIIIWNISNFSLQNSQNRIIHLVLFFKGNKNSKSNFLHISIWVSYFLNDLCEITTKTMRERSATISSCTPILITSYQRAGDLQKTTFLICLCIYPLLRNSYKISYLIEEFSVNLPHVFDSSQTLTLTKQ